MALKETTVRVLHRTGLQVFEPLVRLAALEEPKQQLGRIAIHLGMPLLAMLGFLLLWSMAAARIETAYGTLPTPGQVWDEGGSLVEAHFETRRAEEAFYVDQQEQAAQYLAEAAALRAGLDGAAGRERVKLEKQIGRLEDRAERAGAKRFTATPTYLEQIVTSLKTVFTGFVLASLVAVPLGILCGMSPAFMSALNPLIQIFKPVSPLAWLPIVTILVGALYSTEPQEAWFEKSFITSAITVALCSLWPALVNTAQGVSNVDRDHVNVSRVLQLTWFEHVRLIVLPSALPLIFTGLRISLGVGWMVLIAAEMLAQNPGLGKFIWDMFQNGSSQTLARIMVAVFTIGLIGFALDRGMVALQRCVTFEGAAA